VESKNQDTIHTRHPASDAATATHSTTIFPSLEGLRVSAPPFSSRSPTDLTLLTPSAPPPPYEYAITTPPDEETQQQQPREQRQQQYTPNPIISESYERISFRGTTPNVDSNSATDADGIFSCVAKIQSFGPIFWLLLLLCVIVYGKFNNFCLSIYYLFIYLFSSQEELLLPPPFDLHDGIVHIFILIDSLAYSAIFISFVFDHFRINLSTSGIILPFNNVASSLLLERTFFVVPPLGCQLRDPYSCQDAINTPIGCPSSPYTQPPLPKEVWIAGMGEFSPLRPQDISCSEAIWRDGCAAEYCLRLNASERTAAEVMSIPYLLAAFLSPLLGALVDRFGCRAVIAVGATAVLFVVHALLGFTEINPAYPLLGQGVAYASFAAVIWPAVPLVVEEKLIGLAYGILACAQNGGLAVFPLLIAAVYNSSDGRFIPNVEVVFMSLATLGVIVGLYMNIYDRYYNKGILNASAASLALTLAASDADDADDDAEDNGGPDSGSGMLKAGTGISTPSKPYTEIFFLSATPSPSSISKSNYVPPAATSAAKTSTPATPTKATSGYSSSSSPKKSSAAAAAAVRTSKIERASTGIPLLAEQGGSGQQHFI
jgi:MFS family permease